MKKIKQALALMADYYNRNLPAAVLQMMASDLAGFPEEKVIEAIRKYRQDSTNRSFPLPAQIIDIVKASEAKLYRFGSADYCTDPDSSPGFVKKNTEEILRILGMESFGESK